MGTEIDKIHHVGHVVQDMEAALELYRKLGFVCTPPAYPMMAEQEGEAPKPFGAANAHTILSTILLKSNDCAGRGENSRRRPSYTAFDSSGRKISNYSFDQTYGCDDLWMSRPFRGNAYFGLLHF